MGLSDTDEIDAGINTTLTARADQLRRDFDNSFMELPRSRSERRPSFLAIGVGAVGWALRMQDVAGIYRQKKITALPGGPRELIGLANIRGSVLPVYDLRVLLNVDAVDASPSWLVVTAPPLQIGLAFDRFDRYVQQDDVQREDGQPADGERQTLRTDGQVRPIVDLQPILEAIARSVSFPITRSVSYPIKSDKTHLHASPGE